MVGKPKELKSYMLHVIVFEHTPSKARLSPGKYLVIAVHPRSLTLRCLSMGTYAKGTVKGLFGLEDLSDLLTIALPPARTMLVAVGFFVYAYDTECEPLPMAILRKRNNEMEQKALTIEQFLGRIQGMELSLPNDSEGSSATDSSSSSPQGSEPPIHPTDGPPLALSEQEATSTIAAGLLNLAALDALFDGVLVHLERHLAALVLDLRTQTALTLEQRAGVGLVKMFTAAHIADVTCIRVPVTATVAERLTLVRQLATDIAASLSGSSPVGGQPSTGAAGALDGGRAAVIEPPVPHHWPLATIERNSIDVVSGVAPSPSRRAPAVTTTSFLSLSFLSPRTYKRSFPSRPRTCFASSRPPAVRESRS